MALHTEHEIHQRRFGRNVGLGVVLAAFVVLIFGMTVVKVTRGDPMQAFDHTARPEMVPVEPAEGAAQ
ncbi:hypothetical protein [Gemmobacter serpentinus]|uniref:hypothetical protein n=1 Tax=Gemmobacter serpentinus TaxID=2652247 RepID=UPI00124BF86D|nr:hypothetical protein [Gemmobacter serpentinus]